MKLIITLLLSIGIYFLLNAYHTSSLVVWIVLIVFWTLVDYFFYHSLFKWKDYLILVLVLSLIEAASYYGYVV